MRRFRKTSHPLALGVAFALVGLQAVAGLGGCKNKGPEGDGGSTAATAATASPGGLTPEQAGRVVAKVGEKAITLGDFAAALERMDQFDRLRYQTKERRRELLDELIDVGLLAEEARRRGIDKRPETEEALRQVLRDALLAEARSHLPAPAELSQDEVRAYYERHADRFREPERRRVSAIVLADTVEAARVLEKARKAASASEWGELVQRHSPSTAQGASGSTAQGSPGGSVPLPVDLAGDLGIVGPLDDARGANPKVPEAVRKAAFEIADVGGVHGSLVAAEGKSWIVRLAGRSAGHVRSLAEADRAIRVFLLQEKMVEVEAKLEQELRKKFPVAIDEQALGGVKVPSLPATAGAQHGQP